MEMLIDGQPVEVDDEIAPVVAWLNANGHRTVWSGQGARSPVDAYTLGYRTAYLVFENEKDARVFVDRATLKWCVRDALYTDMLPAYGDSLDMRSLAINWKPGIWAVYFSPFVLPVVIERGPWL